MQKSPTKRRRSSLSSNKSFHSIDQFKYRSTFATQSNKFPLRPCINLSLILLTTVQVFLLISSRIYLRGQLVRSFLSIYVDQQKYPALFEGKQFYLDIINIKQLKDHFQYLFKRVNIIEEDSFVDFFYKDAKFELHTQYKQFAGSQHRKNVHPIDPKQGIVTPFNMSNITDMQLYLLQVSQFQIQIDNLTMRQNWQGFSQRYSHDITYTFIDNIQIQINFDFRIRNAMVGGTDQQYDQGSTNLKGNFKKDENIRMANCIKGGCYYKNNQLSLIGQQNLEDASYRQQYIIRIQVFYGFVLLLALISLYLNYISIRRTYKILYEQLTEMQLQHQNPLAGHDHHQPPSPNIFISKQQQDQIYHEVHSWVQRNKLTISQIKISHYFHILQFDIIFSTLSNIFQIITAFYLVSGIQKQRIAGITCMLSWMTIFKFIRNYKKLVIMYQLIKVSIATVIAFFLQFLPVFLSYALLGMCLFPKVSFFSSLANSVTTLVCLMMGDSIDQITNTITQKNSILLSMAYIFSFVLLFMHAIHNTLTSLIKQFFIIKKIQLVNWQKTTLHEQKWIYIQQLKIKSEIQKRKLPLKLTDDLLRGLLRIKALNKTKNYQESSTILFYQMQNIRITEKWMIQQNQIRKYASVKQELVRRSLLITKILKEQFGILNQIQYPHKTNQTIIKSSSIASELQETSPLRLQNDEVKQSILSDY